MEKNSEPSIFILPANSTLELNFQTYRFEQQSAVFIPSGQYIRSDQAIQNIAAETQAQYDYRYLFSNVISLGHILADRKVDSNSTREFLDLSSLRWKKLNPFNTSEVELEMLFDANDWLENNLAANIELTSKTLPFKEVQRISKEKLRLTFFQWKNQKLINSARKTLYDSSGSVKETSYALGFKDTSYFCRFFKKQTHISPGEFVKELEERPRLKKVALAFQELVQSKVKTHHDVSFYAQELHLTTKNLNRLIKSALGTTPKQYIIRELITQAKSRLQEGQSVTSLAFEMGFEEISHFSSFFKQNTGRRPSQEFTKSTIN